MKILIFFVRYGEKSYPDAFAKLLGLYKKIGITQYDAIIIDNALPEDFKMQLDDHVVLMGGDNSRREFSGWQKAFNESKENFHQYDLVNLVTSAFENEYNGFYSLLNLNMLQWAKENNHVVLGHVDSYLEPICIFDRCSQAWACSKFIFFNPSLIQNMSSFLMPANKNIFFGDSNSQAFATDAPLSLNYQKYLLDWICGDGLSGAKWHSVFKLNELTMNEFKSKAMTIIDEHALSQRICDVGYKIVDFTWLHANWERKKCELIPCEMDQVIMRNSYLSGQDLS